MHGQHAARNRLVVMVSFLGGLRAGEIAALKLRHVINDDGSVRDRIHLSYGETKGDRQRTVIVGKKLQTEIGRYMKQRHWHTLDAPLIRSQKGGHFSPTTMVMSFRRIYDQLEFPMRRAIPGGEASSPSSPTRACPSASFRFWPPIGVSRRPNSTST